ncbi:MAG: nucleotidyltransferase [Gammaproteobacteria bacterium]|nr:nucleotidyltransferase [Gammaproteobacteria bacterium]
MGGGGGGRYIPASSPSLRAKVDAAREAEAKRLEGDVNGYLQDCLKNYNDRDAEKIGERLGELKDIVGDDVDIDSVLFGGSVAKHTYVEGLSDVDALLVLNRENTVGLSPQQLLDNLTDIIRDKYTGREIESVDKGNMAVTVAFRDGSEVQLLPAVRVGKEVRVPDASGSGWNATNPAAFKDQLTSANKRLDGSLVPTIKLMKALVSRLPEQQRLTGYHLESLALDAASGYKGGTSTREVLMHALKHSSERVKTSLPDATGQSRTVDGYLGAANSTNRRVVSQALASLARRLESARSVGQWKSMFEGDRNS